MLPNKLPIITPASIPVALPNDSYFLPSGCAIWLKMDSAVSLVDYSGNGITGTPAGLTLVDGPSSKVLSFPGSSSFIRLPTLEILSYDQTYEWWLKPVSLATQGGLFCAYAGRSIYILSNAQIQTKDSNYAGFTYTAPLDWQHLILTIQGGVGQTLYANGVAYSQTYGNVPDSVTIGGTASIRVGSDFYGSQYYFNGLMGCFRAYSRALDASEVLRLFEQDKARYGIN